MKKILLILLFTLVSACNESLPVIDADTKIINAVVWTGEPDVADQSVIAIKDGNIAYVGSGDDVLIKSRETIDAEGQFTMYGFTDNHVHFFLGGELLAGIKLMDANSKDVFVSRVEAAINALPKGQWLLGGFWDNTLFGDLPTRQWIDAVSGDVPVFLDRIDGHAALANTAALKLAGITKDTPVPEGGEIIVDENGDITGVFRDNAMQLVRRIIPDTTFEQNLETIERTQQYAFSLGVTQVSAMPGGPQKSHILETFYRAHMLQKLNMRINVYTPITYQDDLLAFIEEHGEGDDMLRWPGVKAFADGSLGSTTAWLNEPYTDDIHSHGFPVTAPDELRRLMHTAHSRGLQLAIHAIGDRAVDSVLTYMEELNPSSAKKPMRIEHFQHPNDAAINKAAQLGIVASSHPGHLVDDGRWADGRLGAKRIKTTYAFRDLLDNHATISFGSDWPVASLNPMFGVWAAVTRQTSDGANSNGWVANQKITVEEALRAYTVGNATMIGEQDISGTVTQGKRADLVILSHDPRSVDADFLRDIKVERTILNGQTVFTAQ